MPAVSVVMPAFNVARYIGAAIESVRRQTFTDVELLIVDDGSTDETRAIAARHSREDARIRIVSQPNGGISCARNTALGLASGGVFALLDSDDLWAPGYLAAQLDILAHRPEIDIVTGNAWYLGGPYDRQTVGPWPDHRRAPDLASILADETAVFIMSVFRRRVYDRVGGFDESLRTNEDYDFWLRAAAAGCRFCRNEQPLGRYRRRDDSLSANELRMLNGVLLVYRKMRPTLAEHSPELAILDAQVARFETNRLAAEARHAIEDEDYSAASEYIAALYGRRGGTSLRIAGLLARWAPGLLSKAYHLRRARQTASLIPNP